jgi:hypothetical protein
MATTSYPSVDKTGGIGVATPIDAGRGDKLGIWIDAPLGSWLEDMVVVRDVYDPVGPQPGYAKFEIPVYATHEKTNQVVLNAPWQKLLHGTRVVVSRQRQGFESHHFWVGRVCMIEGDIESDAIVVTAKDDRWMLQDVRILGRWLCEPWSVLNNMVWQQGWPAVFNDGGRPNMMLTRVMDDDGVYIPAFAPAPNHGLGDDEQVPTDPGDLMTKAGYWTISWILRYLSIFYGPGAASYYPSSSAVVPKLCPAGIRWPRGMGNQIDTETSAYWDEGRGSSRGSTLGDRRRGREINLDGFGVLDAMETLISTAGGYTLGWESRAEKDDAGKMTPTSTISIQPAIYKGGCGGTLIVVRGGTATAQLTTGGRYFTRGNLLEDSSDMVTSAYGVGSLAKIERRVDTVTTYLTGRWSSDRLTALNADGQAQAISTDEGMRSLFALYPEVCSYYTLDTDWDFMAGTSESGYPRADIHRPIMPHLLSWIGGLALDYAAANFPVRVEVSFDGGSNWKATTELVRLAVMDDGTIDLGSLREVALANDSSLPGTWKWAGTEFQWGVGAGIAEVDVRMTIAIPCDHRLSAVAKLVHDTMSSGFDDVVDTPDLARLHADFQRQNVLDLRGLYDLWLRIDSYPRPESCFNEPAAGDLPVRDRALKNDLPQLRAHVRRHLYLNGRLKGGGVLACPQLVTSVPQGYQVQNIHHVTGDNAANEIAINRVVRARHWMQQESGGDQSLETELLLT